MFMVEDSDHADVGGIGFHGIGRKTAAGVHNLWALNGDAITGHL